MTLKAVRILGQPVHLVNTEEAVAHLCREGERGVRQFVIAQNPEKVMKALQDEELAGIIGGKATLLIADGVGLVVAGRILGLPPVARVTGVGLFAEMIEAASRSGKRVFFYGAAPGVAEKAAAILRERYPGLQIVGVQDGYEQDVEKVLAGIQKARPDYLFVALGSPRQEKWIARHFERLPVELVMGVGGTFDAMTGTVQRAPVFMQRLGLEWFYRLLSQPSRVGRMANLPRFLVAVIKERMIGRSEA